MSAIASRATDGDVSSVSLRMRGPARLAVYLDPHTKASPCAIRGSSWRQSTRPKFQPEAMSCLPVRLPISLLSGDSGDTCAARPQPRMHIAHDRITRYTRGCARGNVVACGSIATRWTHAISVATGRPPRVRRPGHFAFGWRGLIARRPDFILMRPARSLARDISRVTSFRPSARSPT